VDPRLLQLLVEQQRAGFPDFSGAHAAVTVPISAPFLNHALSRLLPPSAPVRELELRPESGNRFTLSFRLTKPAFLPRFTISFLIERQPELPSSPVLVLRMERSAALMSIAGPVLRFLDLLPPGIAAEGDRILVNVQRLLERQGQAALLSYLENLRIETDEGRVVLSVRVRIEERAPIRTDT
jgi:hypothetical protein